MSGEKSSMMISLPPVVAAILATEKKIGSLNLTGQNDKQKSFIACFWPMYKGKLDIFPEINSIASYSKDEIIEFLKKNKINLEIPGLDLPGLKFASYMSIISKWSIPGRHATIERTALGIVEAALLKDNVAYYRINSHAEVIIELETSDKKTKYYMTLPPRTPKDEFNLAMIVHELSSGMKEDRKRDYGWSGFGFPKTNLNSQHVMNWLQGLTLNDSPNSSINYAAECNILGVDELGAKVESGFVGGYVIDIETRTKYVIRKPFLIWAEREDIVIFAAYSSWDSWKKAEQKEK